MATVNINNIDDAVLSQDERITKYLQGKMSKEEEKVFLNELEADADFKKRAIAIAHLAKGMSNVGKATDKEVADAFRVADIDSVKRIAEGATQYRNAATVVPMRKWITRLSIAACLIGVVFAGIKYNDYTQTTSLGEQYASAWEETPFRGGDDTVQKELSQLNQKVVQGEALNVSIERLKVLWELSKMNISEDYTDLKYDIGWNLATAYLRDNNKAKALEVLKELTAMYPDDSKVKDLLKKVEQL